DFLWEVRCHLHDITGRANERIMFDAQPLVAEKMGYTDTNANQRSEKFMQDYFRVTTDVGYLTRIICSDLEEKSLTATATDGTKKMIFDTYFDGFPIQSNRLTIPNDKTFNKTPSDII